MVRIRFSEREIELPESMERFLNFYIFLIFMLRYFMKDYSVRVNLGNIKRFMFSFITADNELNEILNKSRCDVCFEESDSGYIISTYTNPYKLLFSDFKYCFKLSGDEFVFWNMEYERMFMLSWFVCDECYSALKNWDMRELDVEYNSVRFIVKGGALLYAQEEGAEN